MFYKEKFRFLKKIYHICWTLRTIQLQQRKDLKR